MRQHQKILVLVLHCTCNVICENFCYYFDVFERNDEIVVKLCQKPLIFQHLSELLDAPTGCVSIAFREQHKFS